MTLLELLLVMTLVGLMLGATAGLFSTLDLGKRAAVGLVQNVIRSARNTALARGSSARAILDVARGSIRAEAWEVIGTWHFESPGLEGAFGLDAVPAGAALAEEGFVGRCLSFGPRGATASVAVKSLPSYDVRDGFAIECAVRAEGPGGGSLVDLGGAAGIALTSAGAVRGWLVPVRAEEGGKETAGSRVRIESPPGTLRPGAWQRLRFAYDRRALALEVDGIPVAESEDAGGAPVWSLEGALVLGEARGELAVSLDSLVILALGAGEEARLPAGVAFDPAAPGEIRFDAGGHLDRAVHASGLAVPLVYDDGARQVVRVGSYGTVE